MYTTDEIEDKIKLARAAGLTGWRLLLDTDRAAEICNGIGADWMPERARQIISGLNPTLILAADIHDLRYDDGGTEEDRELADDEMLANGLRLAEYRYPWYDLRRYWVRLKMREFHAILRTAGGAAFNYRRAK